MIINGKVYALQQFLHVVYVTENLSNRDGTLCGLGRQQHPDISLYLIVQKTYSLLISS